MILEFNKLSQFFEEQLKSLRCHRDTHSYIIGIYDRFRSATDDLSKTSLTILYANARDEQNFEKFQKIADYIFFMKTIFPNGLQNASEEYYFSLAQNSYYSCYRLINKSWPVYENLADDFPRLIYNSRIILNH